MSTIVIFVVGLLVGLVVAAVLVWMIMPSMMIHVTKSRFSVDKTVEAVQAAAEGQGWQVPKVYDLQESLQTAGKTDMTALKVISMCQPDHAYSILSDDKNKKVTAMMPCRIGVYEDSAGTVYVSQMNIGLMSKMFGGTIAEVMGKVAEEEERMLSGILDR